MQKKIIIVSVVALLAVSGMVGVFAHDSNNKSVEPETVSLDSGSAPTSDTPSNASNSSDDSGAVVKTSTASDQAVEASDRSDTVPASPKQTEVRQSVSDEKVYYALATPNDPGYASVSWPFLSMNAPAAWDVTTGSSSTVVAVLDTGFSLNHDDLKNQWHVNSGEQGTTQSGDVCWTGVPLNKATNGCDDDQNGYIDDWRGWDFYNGSNNPAAGQDNTAGAAVSHGTETAGLVGAEGNNGVGIATLSWDVRLMPLKVLSDDGPGYTSDIAAAIYYAVDNGATVINMSLGGNDYDSALEAATDYAYENGVTVVAAAGNCGDGTGDACSSYPVGIIGYPARNPHVISVGAVTSGGARATFSSYGDALDVVAPGSGAMYSPTWTVDNATSLYRTNLYGTSYAAPYVASLVALLQSVKPDMFPDEATTIILGTAQKTGISNGVYSTDLGHGIVNAGQAVAVAVSLESTGAQVPTLYMAGNYKSEHAYTQNAATGTGCEMQQAAAYCAIWLQNESTGYDRVLPYKLSSSSYASWSWNTGVMGGANWMMRSVQGDAFSSPYSLSLK